MQKNIQNGFTLIELLIVVAIVGILAGIAIPAYQDSLIKSRRADAKAALSELSVFMEKLYTATGCYNPGTNKECTDPTNTVAPTLPFVVTPRSGKANYDLSVVVTASTFTLTAAPKTTSPDVKCGSLTLTSTGVKTASTGATDCW